MLIDVVKVAPYPDFTLELEYANGERRQFDTTPLLTLLNCTTLATWSLFRWARVEYGTVVWPGDIDIAPETLYECSKPIVGELGESAMGSHSQSVDTNQENA